MWAAYNRALLSNPLVTKCLTVGSLSALGDVVCQRLEHELRRRRGEEQVPFDARRTLRFGAFGLLVAGGMNHFWYNALEKAVRVGGVRGNIIKTCADQLLFAPIILTTFLTSMTTLEHVLPSDTAAAPALPSADTLQHATTDNLLPALKLNWSVWPAAQLINFTFVPAHHRVGYVSVVLLGWNVILSYFNNNQKKVVDEQQGGVVEEQQ